MRDPSGSGRTSERSVDASSALVPFFSPESLRRLERSTFELPFFTLANHFGGQQTIAMCGPASAVIVLNALVRPGRTAPSPLASSSSSFVRSCWRTGWIHDCGSCPTPTMSPGRGRCSCEA